MQKHATSAAPKFDPANFVRSVDNPWFPLAPGTTYRMRGVADGERASTVFTVTHKTKRILGVTATVVHGRSYVAGKLVEAEDDWYAQDRQGNVWYLGEATKEFDDRGRVETTDGSWQAGVDGAQPGIFMPGQPRVGQSFRQELYKGHAEDRFTIAALDAAVEAPYVTARTALRTVETSRLEPETVVEKHYVRGIGKVAEATVRGDKERLELVSVTEG